MANNSIRLCLACLWGKLQLTNSKLTSFPPKLNNRKQQSPPRTALPPLEHSTADLPWGEFLSSLWRRCPKLLVQGRSGGGGDEGKTRPEPNWSLKASPTSNPQSVKHEHKQNSISPQHCSLSCSLWFPASFVHVLTPSYANGVPLWNTHFWFVNERSPCTCGYQLSG